MAAKACMNPGLGAGPDVGSSFAAPPQRKTPPLPQQQKLQQQQQQQPPQRTAAPVVFPNLTGKAIPSARRSLPLQRCVITSDLTLTSLEERCKGLDISLACLSQSVWAKLLSQYTGELEVSFGTFISDSPLLETERDGCLCKLWRDAAYNVEVAFAPGKTEQDIRRDIQNVARDNAKDGYETVFAVYKSRYEDQQLFRAATDTGCLLYLELFMNSRLDQVQISLVYDTSFFDGRSALLIAREFLGVLDHESSNSAEAPIGYSNLEPDALSICRPSGETPVDISNHELFVHHLFEKHAMETPDKVCLEFLHDKTDEVEAWTFQKLNDTANQIAHMIQEHNVARDEAVPVCLEKGPYFYACILACIKAGVPFTPIDPVVPVKRKAFMIEELQGRYVLSTPDQFNDLGLDNSIGLLDVSNDNYLRQLPKSNPQVPDLTKRSLAYRLYTSGSTGLPKAVSLEVGSVVHAIQKSIILLPLHRDTRCLQFAAITFDMCYFDCFLAWTVGFTLISASKRYLLGELESTVQRLNINFLDLTPSVAATLNAKELPQVEMLYCIGEAMPTKIVEDWEGRCVNSYGPTEAAMLCTITNVNRTIKAANIGQPFDGMALYILDKDKPVILPRMAAGELCISGPQLAREYHRNEAKTASSFISLESGLRLYRTGDLARMLADGTFEFIGRKDDQVKLRGFRIELGEVSAVLREVHPRIKDVVALVLKHSDEGKEQLVTFLSFAPRKNRLDPPSIMDCNAQEWDDIERAARKAAEAALPSYMLPHIYFPINWVPLSAAAKVDKRALGELFRRTDISSLGRKQESVETADEFDEISLKIRDVFAKASNSETSTIGLDTTIYQLGLDSISALSVARALKAIGIKASVLDIIEYPTIRGLKDHVLEKKNPFPAITQSKEEFSDFHRQNMTKMCKSADIKPSDVANVFPCSPMQEGILTQFLQSKGRLYYNAILFELENGVDSDNLLRAWSKVAQQIDILRTGFVELETDDGHYGMITYKPDSSHLHSIRKSDLQCPIDEFVAQVKDSEAQKALHNISRPPWSVTIVRSSASTSYMVFTALHTIYDAQTFQILLGDVSSTYKQKSIGMHPSFAPVLKDMIRVSRDKTAIEASAKYWKSALQDCPVTRFPTMTPLRVDTAEVYASYKKTSTTMKDVDSLCRKIGFSLGSAGQAAWAKILAMYLGERDVCFGTVVSGRTGSENADDVVFPCLTTIPMRVQLEGDNKAVINQVQQRLSQTLKFQHTPLRSIQRALGNPEQSLFDTIFVYQKASNTQDTSKPLWKELNAFASVEYPVSFEIEPTEDGYLGLRLTGRTDILPKEQMDIIVSQFEYCLLHMLQNQSSDVMDLGDIPSELASDTPPQFEKLPCNVKFLHEFVSASAERFPNRVALEFTNAIEGNKAIKDSWTYRKFDNMGNKVANFVLHRGIKTGDLVGICFDKTPQAYFGILGVLKAGCAFVALDFSAPVQRRAFIVKDAGIKIVLTMAKFEKDFEGIDGLEVFALDNLRGLTRYFSTEEPDITDLTPNHLSYVLYTSGTTGTPKGCRITHENAIQAMLSFQTLFKGHWDENSRFLQFASLHFDVSVLEQYWSWSVGVCLTAAPRDLIFQDIANAIRVMEITHIDLTPSLASLITPEDTPSLCKGVFITGGEKLKQDVLDAWGEKNCIYNGYGPTEATIGVTMYPQVPKNGRPSNIGPQFVNVGSMVLKPKTMIPVLKGAVGELCVTGALVGDGYLNREDLTKEKFPYVKGKRMYRTGDLVRQLHDGCFDFLGRADDQVKLRGQRLELGEINETIRNADGSIAEVSTLVCKHGQQQVQQLVSFVSFRSQDAEGRGSPTPAELQTTFPVSGLGSKILQACQSHLPVYMVPTYVLPLTKLPLTVNNKVDERSLRAIFADASMETIQSFEESIEDDAGDLSETEKMIQTALGEMNIDATNLTKHTTFFQLGLDSVSIVGFSNRLRKNGFQGVEVSTVMQNTTIASLANALSSNAGASDTHLLRNAQQKVKSFSMKHGFEICSSLKIEQQHVEKIMPCTPLQEGMIARALHSDEPIYYNTFLFEVSRDTTPAALKEAFRQIVNMTDILRTCFCETSDGLAQVVLKKHDVCLETLEIDAKISIEKLSQGCRSALDVHDLAKPPVNIEFVRHNGTSYLRLSIFHALYDGTSMPMIISDLELALRGKQLSKRMPFGDAVPMILSVDAENAQKFWVEQLKSAHIASLEPKESESAPRDQTFDHTLEIPQGRIESAARELNCTVQAVFQAACVHSLVKLLERQVTVGVITSGRSFAVDGIESCIGPLFNTIPCSLPIRKGTTWKTYAQQAHEFNIGSIPYQHTPLRQISKWIGKGSTPLFDVLFVFQPAAPAVKDSVLKEIHSSAVADYPIAFEVVQGLDGKYSISVTSNTRYFDNFANAFLVRSVASAVADLISSPDNEVAVLGEAKADIFSTSPDVKPHMNGGATPVTLNFTWTNNASIIRNELSEITGTEESAITEKSSIYQIGLDSVEAIRLSSRLQKKGIQLKVSDIMRETTIEKMISFLGTKTTTTKESTVNYKTLSVFEEKAREALKSSKLELDGIEAILPTTPLQNIMVAESIGSGFELYFNHDVLELPTGVDINKLQSSWRAVVKKNPILRTTFEDVNDLDLELPTDYIQVVWKEATLEWDHVKTDDDLESNRVDELIASHKARKVPLVVGVVQSPARTLMVLSISHALYDGRSIGLLLGDVAQEYSGTSTKRPSYQPFLENILNADLKNDTRFWRQLLAESKPLKFRETVHSEQIFKGELGSKLSIRDFAQFCRRSRISEAVLGQACWSLFLSDIFDSDDIIFGTVVSGRDTEESDDYMFPTMNTIPVRAVLHGSAQEILESLQQNYSRSLEHQYMALRDIQRNVCEPGQRLCDTLFVYQKNKTADGDETFWKSIGGASQIEYAVAVEIEATNNQLVWRISASSRAISSKEVEATLAALDDILLKVVRDSQKGYRDYVGTTVGGTLREQLGEKTTPTANPSTDTVSEDSEGYQSLQSKVIQATAAISKANVPDIKPETSIFYLGIDSISAIRLASELRKSSIFISVSEILREATIQKITVFLLAKCQSTTGSSVKIENVSVGQAQIDAVTSSAGVSKDQIELVSPATAGQVFLIKAWESSQGRIFLPTFPFKAAEVLEETRFERACQQLVAANPILRTTFVNDPDSQQTLFQVVLKDATANFQCTNINSDTISQDVLSDIHHEEQRRKFDMTKPSLRVRMVTSKEQSYIFLTLHHALYDAFTLPTLLSQLSSLYHNQNIDRTPAVGGQASPASTKEFWTAYLAGQESTPLPSKDSSGNMERVELYTEQYVQNADKIDDRCREQSVSLNSLALAAFGKCLAKRVNKSSPIFGVYLANRHLEAAQDDKPSSTMPTLNMVPIIVRDAATSSLSDLAKQVQADLIKISTSKAALTSLEDIDTWAGVKVDSFVNFLKEDRSDGSGRAAGLFERVTASKESPHVRDFALPQTLRSNSNSIRTNLDLEVAVRNGSVDVGLFAVKQYLNEEDLGEIAGEIKSHLEEF